ncbi:hypothetical protein RJ641_013846, partial [Dillenia turbinata]
MKQHDKGMANCQDCGNQAKKDCIYMRCRTCCKNRGYHCETHLKGNWISTSRRHERPENQKTPIHKPPKEKFPAVVYSLANFRYVRVNSIDNAVDQYAYQTAVKVAGRVFSGILYDQGPGGINTPNSPAAGFDGPSSIYPLLPNDYMPDATCSVNLVAQSLGLVGVVF